MAYAQQQARSSWPSQFLKLFIDLTAHAGQLLNIVFLWLISKIFGGEFAVAKVDRLEPHQLVFFTHDGMQFTSFLVDDTNHSTGKLKITNGPLIGKEIGS